MSTQVFEITCMLCGTEVGELRDARFIPHRGCERPPSFRGGFLRCCRCGGSVYMERADTLIASMRARVQPEREPRLFAS